MFDRVLAILLFPLLVFLHYSCFATDKIMVLGINGIVAIILLLKTFLDLEDWRKIIWPFTILYIFISLRNRNYTCFNASKAVCRLIIRHN